MSDYSKPYRDLNSLIPLNLQNPVNTSLMANLFEKSLTHEEAIKLFGMIGKYFPTRKDYRPWISQPTLERQFNQLAPVITASYGTDEYFYSFADMINKAEILGIDSDEMGTWLQSQGFNFMPPIDIDKFVNFNSYYWIQQTVIGETTSDWKDNSLPEYYVIAKPDLHDIIKMPVALAFTSPIALNGTLYEPEQWIVEWTSASSFIVVGSISGLVQTVTGVSNGYEYVGSEIAFNVQFGSVPFAAGDTFTIDVIQLSTSPAIVGFAGTGTGTLIGVRGTRPFGMNSEGIQIEPGMRVLVTGNSSSENGLYKVSAGEWERTYDASISYMLNGVEVFVKQGSTNKGVWTSNDGGQTFSHSTQLTSNLSDWESGNYWVHKQDLHLFGLTTANDISQAVRPIIEYDNRLDLASDPIKHRFNQVPLFNLYWPVDGTQAPWTSSIFYYVENPEGYFDIELQRRIEAPKSGNFYFEQGLVSPDGRILGFKLDGTIQTIWAPCLSPIDDKIITVPINDRTGSGCLVDIVISPSTPQQTWLLTAITSTTFEVSGSVSGTLPIATVGVPYVHSELSFFITQPSLEFSIGSKFIFVSGIQASDYSDQETWVLKYKTPSSFSVSGSRTGESHPDIIIGTHYNNEFIDLQLDEVNSISFEPTDIFEFQVISSESPRYAKLGSSGMPETFNGHPSIDANNEGTWLMPPQLMHNPELENRVRILNGDLVDHFKSIISSQSGITGNISGSNNVRKLTIDSGLGGSIKSLDGNANLFWSMMNQRDLTPISLIDFAEQQYAIALNTIVDWVITHLPTAIAQSTDSSITSLFAQYEIDYAITASQTNTFSSTSCPIKNWPVTLPLMGFVEPVVPGIEFDVQLGSLLMVHHDGHKAPIILPDSVFEHNIALSEVLRYDGTKTRGTASSIPPTQPYKGQFWFDTSNSTLKFFDVDFDGDIPPLATAGGQLWYSRTVNELRVWNVSTLTWDITLIPFPWTLIQIDMIANGMIVHAEQILYNASVRNDYFGQALKWDATLPQYQVPDHLQYELSKFAIANSYDPFAPDYNASNAFTWNYRNADFSSYGISSSLARWHVIYRTYFAQFTGGYALSRPDLEPWRLLGLTSKPVSWIYDWAEQPSSIAGQNPIASVTVVSVIDQDITDNIIDGIQLAIGDKALFTAQNFSSDNGIYVWDGLQFNRESSFTLASDFIVGDYVSILKGNYIGTNWKLTTNPIILGSTPIVYTQVRTWDPALWTAINAAHPGIKLCINIFTDELLPPYVSPLYSFSSEALLTNIPSNIDDRYIFGDEGPVENVWRRSISFKYAQLKSSFKVDPINFLRSTWGFQTFIINELTLDRIKGGKLLSHFDFTLHGESRSSMTESATPNFIQNGVPVMAGEVNTVLTVIYQQANDKLLLSNEDGTIIINHTDTVLSAPSLGITSYDFKINENGTPLTIGDSFQLTLSVSNHSSIFVPAPKITYLGLNQLYTQFLSYNAIDITTSHNLNLLRKWKTKLAYRTGTLFEAGNFELASDLHGKLPNTCYSLVLNKSELAKSSWLQALRVEIIKIGSSVVVGKDSDGNTLYIPKTNGSDWTFRIENYFSRHPRLDTYTLDTSGLYETFNALSKENCDLEWINYQTPTGQVQIDLPINITGIQNVVNFIHAYGLHTQDEGFAFAQGNDPATDPQSGRLKDWQFEVEQFIDNLYRGCKVGNGYPINPFMEKFWLFTPTGLPASFSRRRFDDILTAQFGYDILGDVLLPDALSIIRFDDHTEFVGRVPLFGLHINIDEYEHLVVFDNYIQSNTGLLYDPFLGISVEKLQLNGKAKRNSNFRPTFGGFFLNGNDYNKNVVASIDDMGDYYNASKVYDNDIATPHALSLLGFNKKAYFDLLRIDEKTEFNFWRALINAKGTNYSVSAFLNSVKFEFAQLDEFWAYKIAEYGDARPQVYPELKLNITDCILKHTRLFFEDGSGNIEAPSSFISISPTDETRWFSLIDLNTNLYFEPEIKTFSVKTTSINEIVQLPNNDGHYNIQSPANSIVSELTQTAVSCSMIGEYKWELYVPSKPKFSPIKLFDYVDKVHVEDITTWHPAFDNHTAIAMEVVNMMSVNDPAKYTYSTLTNNNPNYDPSKAWGDREVGRTWWDQSLLDYIPYFDKLIFPQMEERLARWGSLAEYSNINLYEWVKSDLPPEEYNAQAKIDQLSADIESNSKKTGSVGRKQTYKRSRKWQARSIAWSYVPTPPEAQDVQAFKAGTTRVYLSSVDIGSATITFEHGRPEQYFGTVLPTRLGGFLNGKPYGEITINGSSQYIIGTENELGGDMAVFSGLNSNGKFDLVQVVWSDNKNYIGASIGNIDFTTYQMGSDYFIKATERASNLTVIQPLLSYSGIAGEYYQIDFAQLGIKIKAMIAIGSENLTAAELAFAFNQMTQLNDLDVVIRSYLNGNIIIPFPSNTLDNILPIEIPISYDTELTVAGNYFFNEVTFIKGSSASLGTYYIDGYIDTVPVIPVQHMTLVKSDGLIINDITNIAVSPLITEIEYNFGDIIVRATVNPIHLATGISASDVVSELSQVGAMVVLAYDVSSGTAGLQNGTPNVLEQFGWRAWTVPTQEELDADLKYPHNSWMPVYGDWVDIPSTRPMIDAISDYNNAPLVLNDGTTIEKYKSIWNNWIQLQPEIIKQNGTGSTLDFIFSGKIDTSKFMMYLNGISQATSFYSISETSTNVASTTLPISVGHKVVAIVSTYEPSASDLAFDPDVKDDPRIQVQYKNDYQYVTKPKRDESGNIIGTNYYFWVQGKSTIPYPGTRNLSIQQAQQLLTYGPSTYLTFQELDSAHEKYRAITIAGLNSMIAKDNTFKLRFTRDFTLRDDPLELDLKNTHAEWILMRPKQKFKIPEQLWEKLVDSACGQDKIGQSLPSLVRVLYDERHGTQTKYGFGSDQVLAEKSLIIGSLTNTILNTKTTVYSNGINTITPIAGIDFSQSDTWFATPASTRQLLDFIWRTALPQQINELFFEVLNDALSNNYEFSDIFKTSRISAHSIMTVTPETKVNDANVYY